VELAELVPASAGRVVATGCGAGWPGCACSGWPTGLAGVLLQSGRFGSDGFGLLRLLRRARQVLATLPGSLGRAGHYCRPSAGTARRLGDVQRHHHGNGQADDQPEH
jgi:hypothetical protein